MLISSCQFSSCCLLSAVCNCRLTVGTSTGVIYHPPSPSSGFGDPPETIKNPSKFQPPPVPSKTRKSEPRVTKSLPKWSPKPPPGHLNLKLSANCKSNKNHCIYYVLGTSRHRVLVPCPLPNHKKNHSGIHTAIRWSKLPTSRQNDSKVGPPGLPKSIKNPLKSRFGPQGVRPNSNLFPVP